MNAISFHVSAKHRKLLLPPNPELLNVFGSTGLVTHAGNQYLMVDHGMEQTRFLRNCGFAVPSPITTQYDWEGGTPFEIQKKTAELLTLNYRAYVLNGMGTGKTKSALWAWRYLNRIGAAGRLLVLAPLSTLNFTWAAEVFRTLPGVNVQILHGDRARRLKRFGDLDAGVYIINHDGLAVIKEAVMQRPDVDVLCIDELAVYRNGGAARTKLVREIAKGFKYVWGMTGGPTPNAPTDAWGQCTIVTPSTVPKFYGRFRDAVMTKVAPFRWVAKPNATEHVYSVMQPSVRYTLDDVTELPDMVERTVDIDMGKKQAQIYNQMEGQAVAMTSQGAITGVNAGAVLNKLLQIACGWVYTTKGDVVPLDNDARLDALVDHVLASDNKVLVFVPFKHALAGIEKKLKAEGVDCYTVSGDTPKSQRDTIFHDFQNTPLDKGGVRVIAAHPQCMSHGLTLTAADTIIWFSPTTSLETFEQANARIRRVGQKNKQLLLMFQGAKVEKQMYARLRSKEKVQDSLLSLFSNNS